MVERPLPFTVHAGSGVVSDSRPPPAVLPATLQRLVAARTRIYDAAVSGKRIRTYEVALDLDMSEFHFARQFRARVRSLAARVLRRGARRDRARDAGRGSRRRHGRPPHRLPPARRAARSARQAPRRHAAARSRSRLNQRPIGSLAGRGRSPAPARVSPTAPRASRRAASTLSRVAVSAAVSTRPPMAISRSESEAKQRCRRSFTRAPSFSPIAGWIGAPILTRTTRTLSSPV